MSPRSDVKEERRKQILDAAMLVFTRHGYDKARMDDIAQEAGLSKGSLYWYFESKKDLFLALLNATTGDIEPLGEIGPGHGSASDRIRLMANLLREMMGGKELTSITANFVLQHRHDEVIRKTINDVYESYLGLFANVIRDGIASGEFRDDLDPEHAAGAMVAAFDGLEMQVLFLPEMDWQTRTDQMVEIFVSGLVDDALGEGE